MDHQRFKQAADRLGQAAAERRHALAKAEQDAANAIKNEDLPRAAAILENLLAQKPDSPGWWHDLACIRLHRGEPAAAVECWAQALGCTLNDVELLYRIGQSLEAVGHEPVGVAEKAWNTQPAITAGREQAPYLSTEFHAACRHVLRGNWSAALPLFKQTFLSCPSDPQATRNLCFLLERLGKSGHAKCILAVKRLSQGRFSGAVEAFDAAPEAARSPEFLDKFLHALRRAGQDQRVLDIAGSVDPGSCPPDAYMEWAGTLMDLHLPEAAAETLRRGAASHENDFLRHQAATMIPHVPDSQRSLEQAHGRACRAIHALAECTLPPDPERLAGLERALHPPFLLPYLGNPTVGVARAYGGFVQRVMQARHPQYGQPLPARQREAGERIRIGYATSHANWHVVMMYFAGWLQHADRQEFEIHLFPLATEASLETGYLSGRADISHPAAKDVEVAASQIRESRLDVLVYPEVGLDPITFRLAAMRLAPVQCVAGGHPVTTGLDTLDYFVSTTAIEPPDAPHHYTERLVSLPGTGVAMPRPPIPTKPRPRGDFGLASDKVVYLSTQSLVKYLPHHDDVFARIAQSLDQAVFVFVEGDLPAWTRTFSERLETTFRSRGLDPAQHLRFLPRQDYDDYLSLTAAGDVFLDPLGGFSAGMTAVDALSIGIPIVTLPGNLMRTRTSYGILNGLDITDTIATDIDDYVRLAILLGKDAELRADVSRRICERVHLLFDDVRGVRGLEAFYRWAAGSARPGDEMLFTLWPEPAHTGSRQ